MKPLPTTIRFLLLSIALLGITPFSISAPTDLPSETPGDGRPAEVVKMPDAGTSPDKQKQPQKAEPRVHSPEKANDGASPSSLGYMGVNLDFLPAASDILQILLGIATLLVARKALLSVEQHGQTTDKLPAELRDLQKSLKSIEKKIDQEKGNNHSRSISNSTTQSFSTTTAQIPAPAPTQRPAAIPFALPPQPLPPPPPPPVSKAGLIAALNSGDRQQLQDAAKAKLNINSASENAIATGRSMATELEEAPGGGSYWLVVLEAEHWLFPTDRTLKGFADAQPAKGLFSYEKQIIAKPQLIEPALLEPSGEVWIVKTMGKIGTP